MNSSIIDKRKCTKSFETDRKSKREYLSQNADLSEILEKKFKTFCTDPNSDEIYFAVYELFQKYVPAV